MSSNVYIQGQSVLNVNPSLVIPLTISDFDPGMDTVNGFTVGWHWLNKINFNLFYLAALRSSNNGGAVATWIQIGSAAGPVLGLTGDSGGEVFPLGGNINIVGGTGITVTGNPATHTLTIAATGGSGTVTSITEGTGITLTPNPITTTGSVALTIPVVISSGGTNATSFSVTDGTVYYDGTSLVTVASVGTSGQVLTSNGVGVAPTFQAAGGGGITTITGDTGSVTGATISINANNVAQGAGASVSFVATTGTNLQYQNTDANGNLFLGKNAGTGVLAAGGSASIALGPEAMDASEQIFQSIAIGIFALGGSAIIAQSGSSSQDIFIGFNANTGNANYNGGNNIGIGTQAFQNANTNGAISSNNIGIGTQSLASIANGTYIIGIGAGTGGNYNGSETSNICLNSNFLSEIAGESNTLRIGAGTGSTPQHLNKAFISGINGITVATADQVLVVNSSNQIGAVTPGTTGQVLTSNGAGANPSWQSLGSILPLQSIMIANNDQGGLNILAGVTYVIFGSGASSSLNTFAIVAPTNGTFSKMYVYVVINGDSASNSATMQVNGATPAGSLSATYGAGATGQFTDLIHTVTVVAGDLVNFQMTQATTGQTTGSISVVFTASI